MIREKSTEKGESKVEGPKSVERKKHCYAEVGHSITCGPRGVESFGMGKRL